MTSKATHTKAMHSEMELKAKAVPLSLMKRNVNEIPMVTEKVNRQLVSSTLNYIAMSTESEEKIHRFENDPLLFVVLVFDEFPGEAEYFDEIADADQHRQNDPPFPGEKTLFVAK